MHQRMGMQPEEQPAGRLNPAPGAGREMGRPADGYRGGPPGRQETVISKDGNMVLKTPPTAKSVVVRLQLAH